MKDQVLAKQEISKGGYCRLSQGIDGWPGSGFTRRVTEVKVRRVMDDDRNELQIEIGIAEYKESGRLFEHHGSLTLSPEHIEMLRFALERPAA